jgi:hypothetical protein
VGEGGDEHLSVAGELLVDWWWWTEGREGEGEEKAVVVSLSDRIRLLSKISSLASCLSSSSRAGSCRNITTPADVRSFPICTSSFHDTLFRRSSTSCTVSDGYPTIPRGWRSVAESLVCGGNDLAYSDNVCIGCVRAEFMTAPHTHREHRRQRQQRTTVGVSRRPVSSQRG